MEVETMNEERQIYEKIEIEAEKGTNFEILNATTKGKLVIIVKKNKAGIYSENYMYPPILDGYKAVKNEWLAWKNGFIIERISDGSQFGWVPVGYLDSNGIFNGCDTEKFGRRKYGNCWYFEEHRDPMNDELLLMYESVKKYGGFYISRYDMSINEKNGKLQSVKNVMPWNTFKIEEAIKAAATFENNEKVKSHMMYGSEVDTVLEWFIDSGARTRYEVIKNSKNWGNYASDIQKTGSDEKYCTNGIYDFTGNGDKLTQEMSKYGPTLRGGYGFNHDRSAYNRCFKHIGEFKSRYCDDDLTFHIALWIA